MNLPTQTSLFCDSILNHQILCDSLRNHHAPLHTSMKTNLNSIFAIVSFSSIITFCDSLSVSSFRFISLFGLPSEISMHKTGASWSLSSRKLLPRKDRIQHFPMSQRNIWSKTVFDVCIRVHPMYWRLVLWWNWIRQGFRAMQSR